MKKPVTLWVFALSTAMLVAGTLQAQSTQPNNDTYTWHSELVALDENARNITLKSRVWGDEALAQMKNFKSGDKIVMIWSGIDKYANGVYRVVRNDSNWKAEEKFVFPD